MLRSAAEVVPDHPPTGATSWSTGRLGDGRTIIHTGHRWPGGYREAGSLAVSASKLTFMVDDAPLPNDLPIIERTAVRIVLLDAAGDVLLFHTHDPDHPDLGAWWELPGGGIDPGETYVEAAIRELREETGIVAERCQVGLPNWQRRASFRHRQQRHLQDLVIVTTQLRVLRPDVDEAERLDYEREDYFGFRWWPRSEILSSVERFYPGRLPALLDAFLDGEQINEPFELWS